MDKIKVFMALPSTGNRSDAQCVWLRHIEKLYGDKVDFVYPEGAVFRIFHDFARNALAEDFLATDCDMVWFIDSDVVPAPHTVELITKHFDKWQAAGAGYPIWMKDRIVFTVYEDHPENAEALAMTNMPKEGQKFVGGLATGCLMLKREVFELLDKPYFEFKYDNETREIVMGEDLGFAKKLSKLGIKFFTDFSMVCKHYKNVDLLDLNNYAIEYGNNQVMEYDKQVRPMVEELQTRYKAAKATVEDMARNQSAGPRFTKSGLFIPE